MKSKIKELKGKKVNGEEKKYEEEKIEDEYWKFIEVSYDEKLSIKIISSRRRAMNILMVG